LYLIAKIFNLFAFKKVNHYILLERINNGWLDGVSFNNLLETGRMDGLGQDG